MKSSCLASWSFLFLIGVLTPCAHGQTVLRIEEDWELQVTQPDSQIDAPQIATMLFPGGEDDDVYFQLKINHASTPTFSAGGLQIISTVDGTDLQQRRQHAGQALSHGSETVRWTQVVQLTAAGFYFGIVNGTGTTWELFGGEESFVYLSHVNAGFESLENYSWDDSVRNTGVTFAGNRVSNLKLKRVRIYDSAGNVTETTLNASAL